MANVRHFIDTQDFTRAELLSIIDLSRQLKAADRDGACPKLLEGASLGMLFEEPSTRTRVSFEVAMTKLGGHALYLKPGEIHLGQRESLNDTADVLERMVDVIEARTLKHSTVVGLAHQSDVPVINGLTDYNHPTQALCDVMTMMEHAQSGKPLADCKITFVGDATNVCTSLALICTQMGMHFTHAAPSRYQLTESVRAIHCVELGALGRIVVTALGRATLARLLAEIAGHVRNVLERTQVSIGALLHTKIPALAIAKIHPLFDEYTEMLTGNERSGAIRQALTVRTVA